MGFIFPRELVKDSPSEQELLFVLMQVDWKSFLRFLGLGVALALALIVFVRSGVYNQTLSDWSWAQTGLRYTRDFLGVQSQNAAQDRETQDRNEVAEAGQLDSDANKPSFEGVWVISDIIIEFENGRYFGRTGCNRFEGNYFPRFANRIEILPPKMTNNTCQSPDSGALDRHFAHDFDDVFDIIYNDNKMLFLGRDTAWLFHKTSGFE